MRHLYVHVPFCARRCSYCDFSIAVRRRVPVDEYVRALRTELDLRLPGDETLETVYLGGGTPSRLGGDGVAEVLDAVRHHAPLAPDAEVTIEANPEDVTAESARAWRAAGVNRVSLGAQSFEPGVLAWMHRVHNEAKPGEAVRLLREAGIGNVSLDLIFALPEGVERNWRADIEQALALQPDHVSLYGLTVEGATPLGRWKERGAVTEAAEDRYEREFLLAHDLVTAAGLEHYEVSNFGRPGWHSRHNSMYWRRVPYGGYGPSAHEYRGGERRWNVAPYAEWVRRLGEGADPAAGREHLDREAVIAEEVYLGLRTTAGLRLAEGELEQVTRWVDAGWGTVSSGVLRLTATGWLRLDSLAADLTARRSC